MVVDAGRRRRVASVVVWLLLVTGCTPLAASQPTPRPSLTPIPLPALAPDQVAAGRTVYVEHCASCHGPNAEGAPSWQQPDSRGDLPAPPHDDTGHTWRHSDQELAEIIRGGLRDPFNKTPELTMPPFKNQVNDQDIVDVIAYFKSLWSTDHRRFQEQQNLRPPMEMPSPSPVGGR